MFGYLAPPLIGTGLCLILIPLVIRKHLQSRPNRWFAAYLGVWSIWGLLIFNLRASPTLEQSYYWEKLCTVFGPLIPLIFYQFAYSVTNTRPNKLFFGSMMAVWGIFVLLSRTDLIVAGMQNKNYGYAPVGGPLWWPWVALHYTCITVGLVHLWRNIYISHEPEEKNRFKYIIAGMMFSFFGGAFDVLPLIGLPLYPGAIIGNIIFCLVTAVAIVRYHMLDVNIIIQRGTSYLLMSSLVALPYVGVIFLSYTLFNDTIPVWGSIIILVLFSFGLQPVWHKVQGMVDRLFFRERYDFLKELEHFSQEVHSISSIKQVASPFVRLLSHALQSASVHLLLPDESGDFAAVSWIGQSDSEFRLERHSPLVTWLQNHGAITKEDLEIEMQLQSLTQKESVQLKTIRAELFFPLKSRASELVGILVLGEKLTGGLYSQSDKDLVLTVVSRMAVELENAVLYSREKTMREELQKQNQQKTEFLHQVAHELKTPLTAIISSSELLVEELPSTENTPQRRLVNNIAHSAWSMDKRISELLDLARLQIGTLRINIQEVEVAGALAEITSVLEVLFRNKDQSFSMEVQEGLPPMKADRDRFEQILVNLLSNANKFSPNGTVIVARARMDSQRIVVEVEDSAQPLSDIEKAKLFEPYYRGEDADKRQRLPGLGLGLAISKRLVEMQNGEMWVSSRPGKGNIFCFSLPAAVPVPAASTVSADTLGGTVTA